MICRFLEVLNSSEVQAVHAATLEVLERTGIKIQHPQLLSRLAAAGATVDGQRQVARFPAAMVEKYRRMAPRKVALFSRDDNQPVVLGNGESHAVSGHDATFYFDVDTGRRTPITKKQVGDFAWLADQLDNISVVGAQGLPQDVPPSLTEAHAVDAMLCNTAKHLLVAPDTREVARVVYALVEAATGTEDLASRPVVSCFVSPTAPLRWTPRACEVLMETVDRGVPFLPLPAPLAGATAPVTLAGYTVLHNAEDLSGVVIAQVLREGTPVVYAIAPHLFNLREGNPSIGNPETMLVRVALAQMAHHYGLPCHCIGFDSDAHAVDAQCVWEKALTGMACVNAGIDLIVNLGMFSEGLSVCYESLVIDHEIFGALRRFQRGIHVGPEQLAVDLIDQIGFDGEYLTADHTLQHFREENWYPELSYRRLYEQWEGEGRPDALRRAREKALEILERDRPQYVDKGARDRMQRALEG